MTRSISNYELAKFINAEILGSDEAIINGLNLCNRTTEYQNILSYVESDKYINAVRTNLSIKSLLLRKTDLPLYMNSIQRTDVTFLISNNPEIDFYTIHNGLIMTNDFYEDYNFIPKIGQNCLIHSSAILYDGIVLGDNVTIGANSVIKKGTIIGNNVTIGCNSVIGSEGFQIIKNKGVPMHVKHLGRTQICDNVYVGDNTDICNSLFEGVTFIGENSKIDNLVHVAHNCYIGNNVVITAGTILCGSSILHEGSWIGVNSSVLNRVKIGENAIIGIGSVVTRDIPSNTLAFGVPAKVKE